MIVMVLSGNYLMNGVHQIQNLFKEYTRLKRAFYNIFIAAKKYNL